MKPFKPAILALSCSLLWGCSTVQQDLAEPTNPVPLAEALPLPEPLEKEPEVAIPQRPFPIDTFYSLLVAELASHRGRYDIELGNYIQEAQRTRDPGVTARATRIARYLSAHQATLSTALLWVELEPNNPEALYIAATELAHAGQLQEAFSFSERLLEMGSTPIFENIAARAGQATDIQRESLLDGFERLLAANPNDTQLLIGKALLLQQNGEVYQALALVQKAVALREDDVPAAILQAQLLYQLERPEEALTHLLNLLQQDPNNRRLRLQYARLLANIDLEKALEQFEILVSQSPQDADLLLSLALVATELGNRELARSSFEQLLDMGEQMDTAHYYLGEMEAAEGNEEAALRHYRQVQHGTDFLPALSRVMDILIRRGELGEAQQTMRNVRRRFPDDLAQLYVLEAQTLARYQHLDQAEALLSDALTLHPTNTELLYSRAMINEQRDMIELTESDLRTIIKYQPNNATALNALGYTLADRTGRYEEAYELIDRALRIEPNDPSIIDSMGWVQYRLGNYEEAVLRLREAMKGFPDHEIAAHLGEVLWMMGQIEEARAVWAQGLELNPDSEIISETLQRLDAEI